MRILDVSSISDVSEMPVKAGTLQFLQDSYKEIVGALLTALLSPSYNPSTVYVLFGGINASAPPLYNISAGAVFYQGEIFILPAANFTASGSNVGVFQIVTSQYTVNADPVTFTDMAVRNVHNIRQMQVIQGASGSGVADFTAASYCSFVISKQLNLTADPTAGNQLSVGGSYPNLTLLVPRNGNLNPVLGAGSINVGDVPTGGVTIPVVFGSAGQAPVQSVPYYVMFTQISYGGIPQDDTTVSVTVINSTRSNTGFSFRCQEWDGTTQSIEIEYIIFAK